MKIAFTIFFLLLFSAFAGRKILQGNPVSDADVLAYSVFKHGDGITLYLYNPSSGETTSLYQSAEKLHFVFSSDGRLAFSTDWIWKNNGEIFILNTAESEPSLLHLSQELDMQGYPLGWSQDGKSLAFASVKEDGQQQAIYIWDGRTVKDITPQNLLGIPDSFDIAWSYDGRLAFTIWFGFSNHEPNSEIYIWDGEKTFNLSQNVEAEDREPVWNTNGEIAFGSTRDSEYSLVLWDGKSYADDLPDVSSFTRIAPQLNISSPFSSWVSDDLLAFEASSPPHYIQVYTWDRETWSNISQNPETHNGGARWSQDGYWAFITFFSDPQRLYVRNERNETVLETNGQFVPAWSSGGSLIFCSRNHVRDWELSRWDRATVSALAQGDEIFAQWRSGQTTVCSDG
jgi:hypothetical protein